MSAQDTDRQRVDQAIIAYYGMDDQLMSDEDFDALFAKVYGEDEVPFAVYRRIFKGKGRERRLAVPMLSLAKATTEREIRRWAAKMEDNGISMVSVVPKYDGLACLVETDDDGQVLSAVSRKTGEVGEDLTYVVSRIVQNRAQRGAEPLPASSYVSVEIILPYAALGQVNEMLGKDYKHPRPAAAGMVRTVSEQTARYAEFLDAVQHWNDNGLGRVDMSMRELLDHDDPVSVLTAYQGALVENQCPYMNDGVVLFAADESGDPVRTLGDNGTTPYWAIAFKFPDRPQVTTLVDVEWRTNRTRLSPVALFDPPLNFNGIMVSRASLANEDKIAKLGVAINDMVWVRRANDIIPDIVGVHKKAPARLRRAIEAPDESVVPMETIVAKVIEVLGVHNCGGATIVDMAHYLQENGLADDHSDVETILAETFRLLPLMQTAGFIEENFERYGEARANTLRQHLTEAIENADVATWLATFGINGIGRTNSAALVSHLGGIVQIESALDDPNLEVPRFGAVRLATLRANWPMIGRLFGVLTDLCDVPGFDAEPSSSPEEESRPEVVITGTLADMSRSRAAELLSENGFALGGSVTKTTAALVQAGKNPKRSSKTAKAEKLGIPVITALDSTEMLSALSAAR